MAFEQLVAEAAIKKEKKKGKEKTDKKGSDKPIGSESAFETASDAPNVPRTKQ